MKHLKIKKLLFFSLFLVFTSAKAQTISGTMIQHAGQTITLTGFNYYDTYELAKTVADSLGHFNLSYPRDYKGMALLQTQDQSSLVLVLTDPHIILQGTHLKEQDSLKFIKGKKNKQFATLAKHYTQRQQAYKAWHYLQPIYTKVSPLNEQKKVLKIINKELKCIESADANAVNEIPKNTYLHWYLPKRQLVSDMPATTYSYTERLPKNIHAFRSIDFKHQNFKTCGLFRELLEGHYFLLENMGQSLDSIGSQMNQSTQYLIDNLSTNEPLLNKVSEELFKLFEKRSLFKASEYLAVTLLNQKQCSLNDDLASKLEIYRKLKVGNPAPDIQLNKNSRLKDFKQPVLLVFGASWCPQCKEDLSKLLDKYEDWKAKLKIIYISIDTDKDAFEKTYKNMPWETFCDFKGWDSQAAKDYYITGTPSYYLLDSEQKTLSRPVSVEHIDTLVKYKL